MTKSFKLKFIVSYTCVQMKEIKTLKKLARDLTTDKETLIQKAEKDAAIISRMSEEALAKEDELGRLRTSLETLQSGRPDAFVMNGACVPGVPFALTKPKGENGDVHIENNENPDEVMRSILKFLIDYHSKLMVADLLFILPSLLPNLFLTLISFLGIADLRVLHLTYFCGHFDLLVSVNNVSMRTYYMA